MGSGYSSVQPSLQTLSAEGNAYAPIRTSMFCALSFPLPGRLSDLFLHLPVIILASPDPQGLSFNLFFTFRRRLEFSDSPRLLVFPPGVDTVAALPAPEIPPFPGVPDQMSSSGL